jgi:hypothetical protein
MLRTRKLVERFCVALALIGWLLSAGPGAAFQEAPNFGDPWGNSTWQSVPVWQFQWRWMRQGVVSPYNPCNVQVRSTDGITYVGDFEVRFTNSDRAARTSSINFTVGPSPSGTRVGDGALGGCTAVSEVLPSNVKRQK